MSETADDFLALSAQAWEDYEKARDADISVRALYNRLYYAAFYAAKAVLLAVGEEPKTHRGTANRLFEVVYGEEALIEKETAAFLSTIQRKRDEADYETDFDETVEDVARIAEQTREFIDCMEELVDEQQA